MSPDWRGMFSLSVSPVELIVRGSAMYLFLFVLFRVVMKRRVGTVGMADILILVIIADAAQNGMSGDYNSVLDAFILVSTIVAWNQLIDWLTYRFKWLENVLEPSPLPLVEHGRILWRNMRHEFLSEEELRSKLREHGVADPAEVERAYMEPDGQITVLKKNSGSEP